MFLGLLQSSHERGQVTDRRDQVGQVSDLPIKLRQLRIDAPRGWIWYGATSSRTATTTSSARLGVRISPRRARTAASTVSVRRAATLLVINR